MCDYPPYHMNMSVLAEGFPLMMRFAEPQYLALLAAMPLVVLMGLRSLAGLGIVRRILAIGARCAVLGLLVLALAGPERVHVTDDQTVIFAIDRSASVPRERQQAALDYVKAASREMRPKKDRAAIVAFDGAPAVEQLPAEEVRVDQLDSGQRLYQTNLAGALRMALAVFPPETARRVVVLSDGNQNIGSALDEAQRYAAAGVPADVLPLRYEHKSEMLVERLTAPTNAKQDATVDLSLVVRSQREADARVLLYHNDALVDLDPSPASAGYPIKLEPGHNRFTIPVPLRATGVHRFRAVLHALHPEDDDITVNNEGRAFTIVGQAERIVILSEADRDETDKSAEVLAAALRQTGIDCELATIGDQALDPMALADCSLVILNNVPAYAISNKQQRALASYVRDLGGGLIAVGGDRAFSVGGYHRTPLDEVLPVETNRMKLKLLSLSLAIVIDRSGSMAGEKIAMARDAARGTVSLLNSSDRIGVIAFDSGWEWIVPMGPCAEKTAIEAMLSRIGGGGGTNMYPALREAVGALAQDDVNLRHVIVLTDGQSAGGDFIGLAKKCAHAGITITTIAVGQDADVKLLGDIAKVSGGRMYQTKSAEPLPRIFIRETMLAGRTGLYERPFTPRLRAGPAERVLRGFTQADVPPLTGYVITSAKPMATAPLTRVHNEGEDPILAYWQVGLGRVAAVTTGVWPRWGPEWMEWPGFVKFWAQCVRYAARAAPVSDIQMTTHVEDERAKVVLETRGLSPAQLASMALAGQVVGPNYEARSITLTRTGPDRFEGSFPVSTPGVYVTSLAYRGGEGDQAVSGQIQAGVAVTYSPEYANVGSDEMLLDELARQTGGRTLDPAYPPAAFEPWSIRPMESRLPIWEMMVRMALIAFLIDVAVRRVAIDPLEATKRLRTWVRELAGYPASATTAATVATLRSVRERVRGEEQERETPAVHVAETAPHDRKDDLSDALSSGAEKPAVAPPRRPASQDEAGYAARLLQAKKAARRRTENEGDSLTN